MNTPATMMAATTSKTVIDASNVRPRRDDLARMRPNHRPLRATFLRSAVALCLIGAASRSPPDRRSADERSSGELTSVRRSPVNSARVRHDAVLAAPNGGATNVTAEEFALVDSHARTRPLSWRDLDLVEGAVSVPASEGVCSVVHVVTVRLGSDGQGKLGGSPHP